MQQANIAGMLATIAMATNTNTPVEPCVLIAEEDTPAPRPPDVETAMCIGCIPPFAENQEGHERSEANPHGCRHDGM